jgi:hypothetical protein
MDQYALKSELAEKFKVHTASTSILKKVCKTVYVKTKPYVTLHKALLSYIRLKIGHE